MTIRKLFLRQAAISAVALFVGAIAVYQSARMPARLLERNQTTGRLISLLGAQVVFSNEYAALRGDRPVRQWDIADRQIQEALTSIEKTIRTPEEREILSGLRWHYARAGRIFERLRFTIGPDAADTPAMNMRARVMVDELSQRLQTMTGHAYRLNHVVATRLARESHRTGAIIGGVFATVFLVLLIDLVIIGRYVIRPLSRLHRGTQAISHGDFSHVVEVDRRDEIGELATAFNNMAAELREMYGRLEAELEDRRRAEEALRSTEQHLRMALDSAQMGTWSMDLRTDRILFDTRLSTMLGLRHGFVGRFDDSMDAIHPDDRQRLMGEIRGAAASGGDLDTSARILRQGDVPRTVNVRGSVLKDATGVPIALSGVAWDITEKKLVEERLVGSQRALQRAYEELESMVEDRTRALVRKTTELERSNADLEQFAYVASHDLQEPLRKISSYGDLLQERYAGELDERGRRYASYMVEGVRRLQELIHALLSYSRLNHAAEPFERVNLENVLSDVLADMDGAIAAARATVRRHPLPVVWGSATELRQMFQNLLSNAIKFRSRPTVQVEISAEQHATEWVIRVKDNGIGIDPEFREKIFVVFQRLHTRAEFAGTGIGLAICKKIAERHNGRIWVESEPGVGSTFCFTVPPAPAAALSVPRPAGPGRAQAATA